MPLWPQLSIIHIATTCNRSVVNFFFPEDVQLFFSFLPMLGEMNVLDAVYLQRHRNRAAHVGLYGL